MSARLIFWFKYDLGQKYHAPRPGFELITSRSWQYISCHWDACSNHLVISDFWPDNIHYLCIGKTCISGMHVMSDPILSGWLWHWFIHYKHEGNGNVHYVNMKVMVTCIMLTLTVLVTTIDAQWEGMGDVGSARYEPALLPPCPTIKVLSYSN